MKIIVASHGDFAKGAIDALEMVTGMSESVKFLCMSEDIEKFEKDLKNSSQDEECIFLTDLVGGHPFNTSVKIILENKDVPQVVIGGFNLALLIEVTMLACNSDTMKIYDDIVYLSENSTKIIANWKM